MKVVIDSSAWYAFFLHQDIFHAEALAFIQTKPHVVTNNVVFEEVVALVHKRFNKPLAVKAGELMWKMCGTDLQYISDEDNKQIFERYQNSPKYVDYVDASVIWLSQKLDLPIFTFDEHFRKLKLPSVPRLP